MQSLVYAQICKSDLAAVLGCSIKRVEELQKLGMPCHRSGFYTLSAAIRWREHFHTGQLKRKILLSKLRQKELIELTGKSRQTIYEWCEKGMPRNQDGTYDLTKVIRWILTYYDAVYKSKHQRIARRMKEILREYEKVEI